MIIRPLSGFRPKPNLAAAVASVPYDVVTTKEARLLAENNPHSFLRIIRSEIELDDSVDHYSDTVYSHAKQNLERAIENRSFEKIKRPEFLIYKLQDGEHSQTGIMGLVSVADYEAGKIKIHEKTRREKEDDRVRHILSLRTHTEPILVTYRDDNKIAKIIASTVEGNPIYDFTALDGIRHTLWQLAETEELVRAFQNIPHSYIADGHHRAASAKRVVDKLRNESAPREVLEQADSFIAVLFPHSELKILPYNRIIRTLPPGLADPLPLLAERFEITPNSSPCPQTQGNFAFYFNRTWHGLRPKTVVESQDPVANLDVSVLYRLALEPIFKIGDERVDKNIDFVGGIHGTKRLEELVDRGEAACAFSLYPVSIEELFQIADQDLIMAPKSTWFEPKLRSGLLVHPF